MRPPLGTAATTFSSAPPDAMNLAVLRAFLGAVCPPASGVLDCAPVHLASELRPAGLARVRGGGHYSARPDCGVTLRALIGARGARPGAPESGDRRALLATLAFGTTGAASGPIPSAPNAAPASWPAFAACSWRGLRALTARRRRTSSCGPAPARNSPNGAPSSPLRTNARWSSTGAGQRPQTCDGAMRLPANGAVTPRRLSDTSGPSVPRFDAARRGVAQRRRAPQNSWTSRPRLTAKSGRVTAESASTRASPAPNCDS